MEEEISTTGPMDFDESLTLTPWIDLSKFKRPCGFSRNLCNALLGFFLPYLVIFTQLLIPWIFSSVWGVLIKMEQP